MLNKISRANIKYITQNPKMVLVIALILTILAGVVSSGLAIELNWVSLAPKGNEAVKEYSEILDNFPSLSNIMVVVESDDSNKMSAAVDALNEEISGLTDYVTSMTVGLDTEFILKYGMLLDESSKDRIYMLKDPNFESLLMTLPYMLEGDIPNSQKEFFYETMNQLLIESQKEELDERRIGVLIRDLFSGNTLLTSEDGKMTMLTIQPSFDMFNLKKLEPGIKAIEDAVTKVSKTYPTVAIGVTGMHVVARDETVSIQSDSSLTTVIAIVLIFLLLYFAFRAVTAPLMAFVPLIVGIVWGVGLTTIVIGRLNMLTAFAAAMLLGLGVDYAIHLYSSYIERRAAGFDKINAISHAINITGPGIITGAMTTAVAFFSLNISKLEMLSELGTVMGLGIVCTLIAVFWILPALIMLQKDKVAKKKKMSGQYKWVGKISTAVYNNKLLVVIILIGSTIFMAYQATGVEFDMNLMNLEPKGLKSIEVMEHLIDEYDMSTDSFSISVDSLEDAYKYHEAFSKLDGVKEVTSIAAFVPKMQAQEQTISELKELNKIPVAPYRSINVETALELLSPFAENIDSRHLEAINKIYYDTLLELSKEMLSFEPLTPSDLPIAYKSQFISEDGKQFLITVYPDFDIWDNLDTVKGEKFFDDLDDVNKQITGTPIFMKVIFDSAGSELLLIGVILLLILLSILMLHFKSLKYALAALLPLILTLVFMLGTMSLLDLKFNMLNFLSILLIIGIGIDNGVHVLHHYKIGERKIGYLFSSVGKAILLTTLTTVFGFGSLMFSSYRGIASLGSALSIGVIFAFVMTIVVLPLLLKNKA